MAGIDYGYDRLERVTVILTEQEYQKAVAQLALSKVQEDGKVNPEEWGCFIKLEERMKGDFSGMERWAEVVFTRRVEEAPE